MANRKMRFRPGSSGSPKHTEHYGDGRDLRSRRPPHEAESAPSERGPRIGPGVLGRVVRPEVDQDREGRGDAPRGQPRGAYSEE